MEHSFSVELATQYGIPVAVFIRHLQFWILKNRASGRHEHEDRTWTYGSAREFAELFPYFTREQVRYVIAKLVAENVIRTGNWNENKWDKSLWYAFEDEKAFLGTTLTRGVRRQIKCKKPA